MIKPQICCFRPLESMILENFGDKNYDKNHEKMMFPDFIPNHL